ncbi:MAG: diguanylate cyclase domain-containing protein [Candidatus Methylumidiphilus sp.]
MHNNTSPKPSPALARAMALALLLGLGGGTEGFLYQYRQEQAAGRRETSVLLLEKTRLRLEAELNAAVFSSNSLAAYWSARHGNPDSGETHDILAEAHRRSRHVRNFALATGYRVAEVYPQGGASPAFGFDFRVQAQQWPALQRGIDSHTPTLAGPPSALAYWVPLFAGSQFSGLLVAQIDSASLFSAAGLTQADGPCLWALGGGDGEMILGPASLLADPEATVSDIAVPGGRWRLALREKDAPAPLWPTAFRGAGWLLAALFAVQSAWLSTLQRTLSELALYDRLTGLPARPLFLDRLKQMIRRTKRNHGHFSVLFIDLDDFKSIRERQGAKAGEMMLAGIGKRLLGSIRHCDTVTRWDGGEFLILLDACPLDQARLIAENLRHKIELPVSYGGEELRVGASIGLATYPDDGRSLNALLKVANAAVRRDKSRRAA